MYKRKYDYPNKDEKTEKQWLKAGYKIKKSQRKRGRECYTNTYCQITALYYSPKQVQQMTDEEIRRRKEAEKIKRIKRETEERVSEKAYNKGYFDGRRSGRISTLKAEVYGTAREWLHRGRIVIDKPQRPIVAGDQEFDEEWGFYYYHILDTVEGDPEIIARYLREWDHNVLECGQPYKGHKWWN